MVACVAMRWAHPLLLGLALAACGRATLDLEFEDAPSMGHSGASGAGPAGGGGSAAGGRGGMAGSVAASGMGGAAGLAGGWQAPIEIGNELAYGSNPAVAIDDDGNAFVTWRQHTPTARILASRFSVATSSWGAAQAISFSADSQDFVKAGFDRAGAPVVALWLLEGGLEFARFDRASGAWPVTPIPNPPRNPLHGMHAVAGTGIAAAWRQDPNQGGDRAVVWAGRYSTTTGWSEPDRLEVSGAQDTTGLWFDASPNDHAGAIWVSQFDGRWQLWAASFDAQNAAWTSPTRIDTADGSPHDASVDVDSLGNATAIWLEDTLGIVTRRYDQAIGGWLTPEVVGYGFDARVCTNAAGQAIAVWVEGTPPRRMVWSRRVAGNWQPAAELFSDVPGDHYEPDIAMNAAGQAVLAWSIRDGLSEQPVTWVSRLE